MIDPFSNDHLPCIEPDTLIAGASALWKREVEIDPTLFDLSYELVSGKNTLSIPVTHVSDTFLVEHPIPADQTAGEYRWQLFVTRKSDAATRILGSGYVTIHASDGDMRSHARIMVDKITSLLEGRADDDVESYSIKTRSISKMSIADLQKWRDYYLKKLSDEADVGLLNRNRPKKNTVKVGFK